MKNKHIIIIEQQISFFKEFIHDFKKEQRKEKIKKVIK